MNLEFFVHNQRLTYQGESPLAADTSGHYTVTLAFDEEWEGLVKVVVFQNGDSTAQVVYTGQTFLPDSVAGPGDLYVACHGYRQLDDRMEVLRTLPMTRPVALAASVPGLQGDPAVYTATLFDQILAAMGGARQAAARVTAALEDLERRRAAGELTGPQGIPGPQGEPGPQGIPGPQGFTGAGLALRERFDSLEDLMAAGDAYVVGNEEAYQLWFWSDRGAVWVNLGDLRGPRGETGRGLASLTYDLQDNRWVALYTDGAAVSVAGPTLQSLGAAPALHGHGAASVTAGTLAGAVSAKNGAQTPGSYLLRNQKLAAAEETPTAEGEILWVYE